MSIKMSIKMSKNLQNNKGFSLIELMVVLVIIGLLAGIIAPKFMDAPGKAKQVKAKATIGALESALKWLVRIGEATGSMMPR